MWWFCLFLSYSASLSLLSSKKRIGKSILFLFIYIILLFFYIIIIYYLLIIIYWSRKREEEEEEEEEEDGGWRRMEYNNMNIMTKIKIFFFLF